MRSLSAVIAGILATVVAIVTVPILWISVHVADEAGYVEFSSELATDNDMQGAFAAYLADESVQRGMLPGRLQDLATTTLAAVARTATNQPGFIEAWQGTQVSLHRSAFGDATGPILVDVTPMANFVADRVGDRLPVSLQVDSKLEVQLGTADDRRQLRWVAESRTYGLVGLMIVVLAAAVCVLAARSRGLALAGLGLGALAVAGLLRLLTSVVTPRLIDDSSEASEFARSVQRLLVERGADSLLGWLEPIAMVGFAAILLGLAGHVVSSRR